MIGPSRCETHGTARAADGSCVLCARRGGGRARSGGSLGWVVALVVGGLIASAVGFRLYLASADRRAASATATAEPDPSTPVVVARAGATAAAPGTAAPIAPGEPRVDPAAEARAEHDRLVAEAARAVQIDLYGEGWCPSCRKARAWLDREGIAYSYRDTSDDVNKHTMRALNPNSTIPTIDIEGQVVVGFDPRAMRSAIVRAAEARVAKSRR